VADELRFQNRTRAESFGSVAEQYDRFRPGYPSDLIDLLAAPRPGTVLDIGCGTGKASTLLQARGLDVLGVELDARMAEVARAHGIPVEVGAFESWDDAGRRFDLIVCGQAWHWVDPAPAVPKVARLLNPGGTLALFWNTDKIRSPALEAIDAVYRAHAPELMVALDREEPRATDERPYTAPLEGSGLFGSVEVVNVPSGRTDSTEQWIGMVRTHSDHVTMDPARREPLLKALTAAIDGLGGSVTCDVTTYLVLARLSG
jgi:SAM-dependent methyltransferase